VLAFTITDPDSRRLPVVGLALQQHRRAPFVPE